ncbi:hypothetical protein FOL46_000596 [Perkinsus olseni]|uniref:BolA-like protein 1 n=1 Tax=Perkinsus olseni TaxID=32597 RepID=A0A7J6KUL9_PEROL|nr:hypothetical protein FOL46_000596 [Perkinsus olseni]
MSRATYTAILRKVTDRLKPTLINIIDDSAKHASHAPMRGSDRLETHFRVEVVSDGFKGLNRVQRQKLMYSILSEEMDSNPGGTVHALKAPSEEEEWSRIKWRSLPPRFARVGICHDCDTDCYAVSSRGKDLGSSDAIARPSSGELLTCEHIGRVDWEGPQETISTVF